jgi:predicted rRNA methylase YqxC with S4 and FtsJ domains
VKGKRPYISRGGETLAHGLDRLDVNPSGLDCLDIGETCPGWAR